MGYILVNTSELLQNQYISDSFDDVVKEFYGRISHDIYILKSYGISDFSRAHENYVIFGVSLSPNSHLFSIRETYKYMQDTCSFMCVKQTAGSIIPEQPKPIKAPDPLSTVERIISQNMGDLQLFDIKCKKQQSKGIDVPIPSIPFTNKKLVKRNFIHEPSDDELDLESNTSNDVPDHDVTEQEHDEEDSDNETEHDEEDSDNESEQEHDEKDSDNESEQEHDKKDSDNETEHDEEDSDNESEQEHDEKDSDNESEQEHDKKDSDNETEHDEEDSDNDNIIKNNDCANNDEIVKLREKIQQAQTLYAIKKARIKQYEKENRDEHDRIANELCEISDLKKKEQYNKNKLEANKKKFEADKIVYKKMSTDIKNGTYDVKCIPPFFINTYTVLDEMNAKNEFEIPDAYDKFMTAYTTLMKSKKNEIEEGDDQYGIFN